MSLPLDFGALPDTVACYVKACPMLPLACDIGICARHDLAVKRKPQWGDLHQLPTMDEFDGCDHFLNARREV